MSKTLRTHELRERRHRRVRKHVIGTPERPRLTVFRSNKHIAAQIIDDVAGRTLVSASTLESGQRAAATGNIAAATRDRQADRDEGEVRGSYQGRVRPGRVPVPRQGRGACRGRTRSRIGAVMPESQYEERTIKVNRVAKVVKGGRRFSFTALMVIGDGNGRVGLGYGKAKEAGLAVQKGIEEARKNMFDVPLAGSTIVHPVIGHAGAGRIILKPAAPGTGVIAGGAARAIFEMAGIRDVVAKSLGTSNAINVAHATIAGLSSLRRPDDVARLRGKTAEEVTPTGVLRAYEERRRLGRVAGEVG